MEIGLVYSSKDPTQKKTRDFVFNFIRERGILAHITESDQPVNSPKVIIDGEALFEKRKLRRKGQLSVFPDKESIAKLLEYHSWCL